MKIKKDDVVKVLIGKDQGKTGKVLRVFVKEGKVLVEGVNMYKRHVRKTAQREGGSFEIAKPINMSNVILVCPQCKKETRVGFKVEDSKKTRICKKCGKEIVDVSTKK